MIFEDIQPDILAETKLKTVRPLNLIPLINVIFLLIIYFLIVGRLQSPEDRDVNLPLAATGAPSNAESVSLLLLKDGNIKLGGEVVTRDALPMALKILLTRNPQQIIVVKADASLSANYLVSALNVIKQEGGQQVQLLVQEKPR